MAAAGGKNVILPPFIHRAEARGEVTPEVTPGVVRLREGAVRVVGRT